MATEQLALGPLLADKVFVSAPNKLTRNANGVDA
jgi:hypothetical protein